MVHSMAHPIKHRKQTDMATIDKRAYAEMFGPTVGDRVRLADTALVIEVEKDFTLQAGGYGEEVKFGGGKVIRDGMGQSQITRADGAMDTVITNALILAAKRAVLQNSPTLIRYQQAIEAQLVAEQVHVQGARNGGRPVGFDTRDPLAMRPSRPRNVARHDGLDAQADGIPVQAAEGGLPGVHIQRIHGGQHMLVARVVALARPVFGGGGQAADGEGRAVVVGDGAAEAEGDAVDLYEGFVEQG